MKREHKDKFTQNVVDVFSKNDFLILVNFKSINASESLNLRNGLKSIDGGFLVVKNTLARLALERANKFPYLSDKFVGPVAIVYSNAIVEVAKLIVDFIDDNKDKMSIICGANSNQSLVADEVKRLANLPSLDELRVRIMQLMSPARLMLSINSSSIKLIRMLDYYSSKE
ncbi:50S ribosomal protein L10 [Wolbachia pipientis]|uniref:50S ribosomal protein L10 n=1 Tax=Wolbachia pipientis TaxID=955 RepID=A0A1E7QKR6_WOLPI|nr:50S ribosomal protein L10 [Wolbachia pipientis]OEY86804.1 50S ribosomal protein L10 [Wolbachia pipientis]